MLHRRVYDFWQDAIRQFSDKPNHVEMVSVNVRELERAQRFVFSESAALACRQLAEHPDQLERAQSQIFAPFPVTWMEFPQSEFGMAAGFHFIGRADNPRYGNLIFVAWPSEGNIPVMVPAQLDLDQKNPLKISGLTAQYVDESRKRSEAKGETAGILSSSQMRDMVPHLLRWALAGWALLATKGMTTTLTPDLTKLNKARARRGKYPLLGFTEIRLNLDVERVVRAHSIVGTGNMPRHPVRAHLRLLASGKVAIVRAHWRGNPEYGVRSHHYSVVRAEDDL